MFMSQSRLSALGLIVLIAGSAVSAPLGRPFGITVTGDRLLGCAAILLTAALIAGGRVRWTAVHTALALFVAVQGVTSVARAASWPQGLKFVTIYVLGFGCFAVAAELARGAFGRHAAERSWRIVGAISGALGAALALVASAYQIPLWGTGFAQAVTVGGGPRVVFAGKVTFPEWNLLSSFLLVAFTFALWGWRRQRVPVALIAIVAGLVFGVTRAAWLAMAGIAAGWFAAQRPGLRRAAGLALMVAVPFAVQWLALGATPLHSRLIQPILAGADWNLSTRAAMNRAVAESSREARVIGRGAGSTNQLKATMPDGRVEERVWTGNMVLFIMHDSGVVGLVALLGVIGAAIWVAHRAARQRTPGWRDFGVPLAVSGLALLWAWQFTHALWLMYPYVFLGLLVACTEPHVEAGGAASPRGAASTSRPVLAEGSHRAKP